MAPLPASVVGPLLLFDHFSQLNATRQSTLALVHCQSLVDEGVLDPLVWIHFTMREQLRSSFIAIQEQLCEFDPQSQNLADVMFKGLQAMQAVTERANETILAQINSATLATAASEQRSNSSSSPGANQAFASPLLRFDEANLLSSDSVHFSLQLSIRCTALCQVAQSTSSSADYEDLVQFWFQEESDWLQDSDESQQSLKRAAAAKACAELRTLYKSTHAKSAAAKQSAKSIRENYDWTQISARLSQFVQELKSFLQVDRSELTDLFSRFDQHSSDLISSILLGAHAKPLKTCKQNRGKQATPVHQRQANVNSGAKSAQANSASASTLATPRAVRTSPHRTPVASAPLSTPLSRVRKPNRRSAVAISSPPLQPHTESIQKSNSSSRKRKRTNQSPTVAEDQVVDLVTDDELQVSTGQRNNQSATQPIAAGSASQNVQASPLESRSAAAPAVLRSPLQRTALPPKSPIKGQQRRNTKRRAENNAQESTEAHLSQSEAENPKLNSPSASAADDLDSDATEEETEDETAPNDADADADSEAHEAESQSESDEHSVGASAAKRRKLVPISKPLKAAGKGRKPKAGTAGNAAKAGPPSRGHVRVDGTSRRDHSMRRSWTAEEEDALLSGVQKFSDAKMRWRQILDCYWEVFKVNARTSVDLKDKWRNIKKSKLRDES